MIALAVLIAVISLVAFGIVSMKYQALKEIHESSSCKCNCKETQKEDSTLQP